MARICLLLFACLCTVCSHAATFSYNFKNANLAEALALIADEHPELQLSFIYSDVDKYSTSANIHTDNAYKALRWAVGLNPLSVLNKGNVFYIEALQKGRYTFIGQISDSDGDALPGAAAMLLNRRDSTVISYGVSDSEGRFTVPCDKKNVLAKFACVGYRTVYVANPPFEMGRIELQAMPIQLEAVRVEATNASLASDKNTYTPSIKQKNAATDAEDLLRRMAIPQLVLTPGESGIKDVFGNRVVAFVNGHLAGEDELKGMNMADVRRVEYMEFPTDARFRGEQRVVNFVVQEYEYGGYTKATEWFRTLNGVFNDTEVFSRFSSKKMTYDLFAGSENENYHHAGADKFEHYQLGSKDYPADVGRTEILGQSHSRTNEFPLTFRASYNSDRLQARNTFSFTHSTEPEGRENGDLNVSLHPDRNDTYTRANSGRSNAIAYQGSLWSAMGQSMSVDVSPSFNHTHRNNRALYSSTYIQNPVENLIVENTYQWNLQANLRRAIGKKNQLSLFVAGGQNIFMLDYAGSTSASDKYSHSFFAAELRHRYQVRRFSLTTFAGLGADKNVLNAVSTDDFFPRLGTNAWFKINDKNQISAFVNFQTTTPDIGMKASDIVQSNEFLYLTGNPRLRNWRNLTSNISYNWFCNNSFSLAAFGGFNRDFNRVATIYRTFDGGEALLRSYDNDGNFTNAYAGISANCKLLGNSLQLYANLTQNHYCINGNYQASYSPFRIQLQAAYYWKAFNVLASWGNPQNLLTENSNYYIRGRNFHFFSAGWGNGTWTVNLAAKNFFNRGWQSATWRKDSPLYNEFRRLYNPSAHASLTLTATYTIGYGLKVNRGNEASAQSAGPSAIVK